MSSTGCALLAVSSIALVGLALVALALVAVLLYFLIPVPTGWELNPVTPRTIRRLRARVVKLKECDLAEVRELAGHAGYLIGKAATKMDLERAAQAVLFANLALATIKWAETLVGLYRQGKQAAKAMIADTHLQVSRTLCAGLNHLKDGHLQDAQTKFEWVWLGKGFGSGVLPEAKALAIMGAMMIVAKGNNSETLKFFALFEAADKLLRPTFIDT